VKAFWYLLGPYNILVCVPSARNLPVRKSRAYTVLAIPNLTSFADTAIPSQKLLVFRVNFPSFFDSPDLVYTLSAVYTGGWVVFANLGIVIDKFWGRVEFDRLAFVENLRPFVSVGILATRLEPHHFV
jgi:hypothetical protein